MRAVAGNRPERVAYRFLADGERETDRLDYGELDRRARAVAVAVRRSCAPDDRVGLVFTPDLNFVTAFLGVLYAGCVAVPVAPPGAGTAAGPDRILADADPRLVLTNLPDLDRVGGFPVVAVDTVDLSDADRWTPPELDGDRLAFLQYTSGSTGSPKGVMVTHGNLMANQAQLGRRFAGGPSDVVVSWLPPHHDMGLIGGLLHPLHLCATAVLMPPAAFLRRPARWLAAISRYRGTISVAPDFAYDLCARTVRPEEAGELDLSSWRVAITGSEPVRASTLRRFTERFAPAGFTGHAFAPSYGMAEATLIISGAGAGREPVTTRLHPDGPEIVSCGRWLTDDVLVVRDGTPVDDLTEGEIWVRGPNVAAGYWRQPAATAETFGSVLAGHRWLRTGDLGFRRDGELYVTGRAKDVLVVRGRNHHPGDIEATVQSVDRRLVPGAGAAFLVDDDLVVVQAVRSRPSDLDGLPPRIRAAVAAAHGLSVAEVVLVRPSGVPRTTSGKVRRSRCRDRYLAGELPVLLVGRAGGPAAEHTGPPGSGPTGDGHPRVRELVAAILDVPPGTVVDGQALTELGLDSLRAVRLQQALADAFGAEPPLDRLLGGMTVAELAGTVASAGAAGDDGGAPGGPGTGGPLADPGATVAGSLPASGMTRGQQALAFLCALDDRGPYDYTIARAVRLPDDVDLTAFRDAFTEVVGRHGQLRSRFLRTTDGVRREERPVAGHDWCALRRLDRPDQLDTALRELVEPPLDLAGDLLFTATVLLAPGEAPVLVLRASHLVTDLYSMATVVTELVRLYQGRVTGRRPALPDPVPFAELVAEEAAYLTGPAARAVADEVAGRLRDRPELRWPVAPPRTGGDGGAAATLELDGASAAAVDALARSARTTRFAVLLAGFALFLGELSGQDEVVIGVPFSGRDGSRRSRAVGYLVNTIPVRLAVPAGTSLRAAVDAARSALLVGIAHARVPLSVVAERLPGPRSAAPAFFDALFDLLDDPFPELRGLGPAALDLPGPQLAVAGLPLGRHPSGAPRPLADLDVAFTPVDGGLLGRFAFDTTVFDVSTGTGLAGHFTAFLRRALARPDRLVTLADAGAAEPAVLLPTTGPVEPAHLGELFRRQTVERPDLVALVGGGREWTYRELGRRVDRVAADLPVVPASPVVGTPLVGLLFDDAVEFSVAMLAALRRGYGVVPLAPDHPDQRLALIVADCGVGAVLSAAGLRDRAGRVVADPAGTPVVVPSIGDGPSAGDFLSPVTGAADRDGQRRVPGPADPHAVVYVVYTSGTTGVPKGVPITSAQVLPLLRWQVDGLGAGPGMRLAQTLALTFDFGLQEIMTTLLFGGTLCVPRPGERHAPEAFGGFLRRDRVDTLFATPTFVRELAAQRIDLGGLRLLVLGGEPLTTAAVRAVRPLLAPDCRIINGYGPTEASINCTMHTVDLAADERRGTVPVGAATGASRVYVLDGRGNVRPAGLLGEVCIGGPGVASGYVDRPAETATRFVPDPVTGGRMYRSGDLGRVVDGELELFGRMDHQVKIRGYRVEPGEVAAVLRALPGVRDAVVLVDRSGASPQLVGFVTGDRPDVDALRDELLRRLPAYLVPDQVVPVPALPLTAHGKLDETGLLRTAARRRRPSGPLTDVQATIAAIWCDVLGLDQVDLDANFFDVGGHSLAVGAVVARLRLAFGLEQLPLHALFRYSTVRLLAQHVDELVAHRESPAVPAPVAPLAVGRRVRGRQRGLSETSGPPLRGDARE